MIDILKDFSMKKRITHSISKRSLGVVPKLAVLTVFFNPKNYVNLKKNYIEFSKHIKQSADLFTIELSFNGEFFVEGDNVVRIAGNESNILWQKERLLNILLQHVPDEYTNIAWIDCDIIFNNKNWVRDVNKQLTLYKVVQLFETATQQDEVGRVSKTFPSSINSILRHKNSFSGVSGYAWAIRRECIDKIGFVDNMILGGGDALMMYSFFGESEYTNKSHLEFMDFHQGFFKTKTREWCKLAYDEIKCSVSTIPGNVLHLYHGTNKNRRYHERYLTITPSDIDTMHIDENNVWSVSDANVTKKIMEYFALRNEDDNILTTDRLFYNTYVINLDRRPERMNKIQHQLEKNGIPFTRFTAIDGEDLDDIPTPKPGNGLIENKYALACLRSHIEIIKMAKEKRIARILVLEDDAILHPDFRLHLQKLKTIKNWKMLHLGASQYNWDVEYTEGFYYSKNTLGGFAYAIDQSIYDDILKLNEEKLSFDNLLAKVQEKYMGQCYTFWPNIVIPDVSTSDIRGPRDQEQHSNKMKWQWDAITGKNKRIQ